MPERLQFPDVAGPAAEATRPPAFEEIVVRARRHRRRTVLAATGAVASLLVAVAVGATLTTGDGRATPQPLLPTPTGATPTPTPTSTPAQTAASQAAAVVRDGYLVDNAVNAKGSLLTVWQRCAGQTSRCRTAWQLQGQSGITRALVKGSFAGAVAAGDSLVVMTWDESGFVLDDRGRARPLREVASGTVTAADALVRLQRDLAAVDPVRAEYWRLPAPPGVDGWADGRIGADGTAWATASVPAPAIDVRIWWLDPKTAAWQHHTISRSFADGPATGPFAVAGDHVAALAMHDGVDVATYGVFAVTTDAGASWSDLRPNDLPFDNVDAMAATSGGTLYVASQDDSGADRVFRSTDATWRHFAEVPGARGAYRLVAAGRELVAARGTPGRTEVLKLDDAGHAKRWAIFR